MRGVMLLLLVLAACRGTSSPGAEAVDQQQAVTALDDTVRLSLGESARVIPAGLVISFDSVLQDSRCPRDVQCVWAGSARVRLTIAQEAGAGARHELESGQEPRAVTIGGVTVTLLPDVQPVPVTGDEGRRRYRIALRVTRP